jgi:hypothetical protein
MRSAASVGLTDNEGPEFQASEPSLTNFVRARGIPSRTLQISCNPCSPSRLCATLRVGESERPVGFNPAIRIAPECRALAAAGFAALLLSSTRAGAGSDPFHKEWETS